MRSRILAPTLPGLITVPDVTDQVVGVVTKTLEPSAVGVWVRGPS